MTTLAVVNKLFQRQQINSLKRNTNHRKLFQQPTNSFNQNLEEISFVNVFLSRLYNIIWTVLHSIPFTTGV